MKVIIAGSRDINDYELVKKAVKASGFKVSMVISGGAPGVDTLGEKWATDNKVKIDRKEAEWNNLKQPGAKIKSRYNKWKKCEEEYNANAGFYRNSQMVDIAEACIAIQIEDTPGTQDTIKKCQKKGIPVFIYPEEKKDKEYKYKF